MATDYLTQTDMTTIKSNVLQSIVDRYIDKPKNLDTLDDIVGEVNALPKVAKIERQYPYVRDVNEIANEGLYMGFEHDSTLILISILREIGIPTSYGFYFKHQEGKQPEPKSVAIAYLPEKGKRVIFDTKTRQINEFNEKIGDFVYRGEDSDPKNMGISDLNTLLRWQEEKRIENLQRMGSQVYTGSYGRRGELGIEKDSLQLPSEIMKSFEARTPTSNKLYLYIGRYYTSSNGVLKYVMALDEKAAVSRGWDQKPRDTKEMNIVEIKDGKIRLPQTFHNILYKGAESKKNAPDEILENIVIEAEREGDFFKILGSEQYFKYFADASSNLELMKEFSFAARTEWGMHNMDDRTRLDVGKEFMALLLARKGIISKSNLRHSDKVELQEAYEKKLEFPLFYRYDCLDGKGNMLFTFLDTAPFDGEIGDFNFSLFDHDGRITLGQEIFDKLSINDYGVFKGDSLKVDFNGRDDRVFQVVIKRPS